ncbi:MAG: hypothetical protein DRP57_12065 [Spirochaetes bacterium]|nr:MAG: hypothetical protein DRP57_12065 [Spirochaetota bacterium]
MGGYKSVISNISSGYFAFIKKIIFIALLTASIAVLSFIIVFPLWILAVKSKFFYNMAFIILTTAALTVYIIIKIRSAGTSILRSVITGLKKIAVVFLHILIIYLIVWLFAVHFTAAAAVASALYLFIAGYFKFVRRKNH